MAKATKTQREELDEAVRIVKARKLFYVTLKAEFPQRVGELDQRIAKLQAEKDKLLERYTNADNVIAESDAALARFAKQEEAEKKAPTVAKSQKIRERLLELAETLDDDELVEIFEAIKNGRAS
jgi:Skp family chaperone for outer membrane proteins